MKIERWLISVMVVTGLIGTLDTFLWQGRRPIVWLGLPVCSLALGGLGLGLATRYRHARQKLESALVFQQQLLDRIPIPTFFKNDKGVYLGCNKSYEQFMGLDRGRIIGKTVFDIAPPELARIYHEQDTCLLAHPGVQVYECEVESKALQSKRHVVFHKATFPDPGGRLGGIIGGIIDITERKEAETQKERLIADLQRALDKVKLLSGLLPICANCKKIRDDKGYWNQIEAYICTHSEANFSHGLCPDCLPKFFPGSSDDLHKPRRSETFVAAEDSVSS